MAKTNTMNFQLCLEDAWRIIKHEPLVLIGGGFLYQLLFFITHGYIVLIVGPLLGGYLLLIILYLRENKRPVFNDLFIGFKQFGNLFPYFLVLLIILIGFGLLIIPGLVFATWWIYVLPLMTDRKLSFNDAMRISMNKVNETGFFMHLIFLLLVTLLPGLILIIVSAAVPFLMILSVLLPPFQAGCLASLYIAQFKEIEVKTDDNQEETAAVEMPLIPPSEKAADAEAGQETHSTSKDQTTTEPADHDQTAGQQEKGEDLTPDQQKNDSDPDSANIIDGSQDDMGKI